MGFPRAYSHCVIAVVVLCGIGFAGCYREVGDEGGVARPRYTGTAAWTIDGMRPGQTFEEFTSRFGQPRDLREHDGERTATWNSGQLLAHFDREGCATEISGRSIRADADTLIYVGASEAEVVQVLGPGNTNKGTRPKGGGVFAMGSEHTHTIYAYENYGARFEVSVQFPAGSVGNLWVRLPDPSVR